MKNFTTGISMLTLILALLFATSLNAQDPCTPTNQMADNITAHSADLSWDNLTSRTWVRYYPTGTEQYKFKFADTLNMATLAYLLPETEYTWELNTCCDSVWTGYNWAQTFTTLVDTASSSCEPTNQIAENVGAHTADLSWEGLEDPTWVRCYPTGTQQFKYKYANLNNTVSFTCLLPETEYTWEINTYCDGVWTDYGWAQSFTTIEDTVVCEPTNQLAENITARTADLSWEGLSGPTWVRYYVTGTEEYRFKYANLNNAVALTWLSPETEYTWEINTNCNGVWTDYGWAQSFTTIEDTVVCEPTNQIAENITAHTADLSWEGLTGPTWVRYYATGTEEYRFKYANLTNTVALTWLTPETEYTWEINTFCNGVWTDYGWAQSFTTIEDTVVCEPTNQIAENITAHTADLSWEGLDGPTWVRYYITGTEDYKYRYAQLNNAASLTCLQSESDYTWELNTFCNGVWTGYDWAQVFTTLDDTAVISCEPTNLVAENVTANSADLNWEEITGATYVRYYPVGTEDYKYVFTTETTVTIDSLSPVTDYEWQINNFCQGSWTGYNATGQFTTLANLVNDYNTNNQAQASFKIATIEESEISELYAFPNPTNLQTQITFSTEVEGDYNISMVNLLGSVILNETNSANEGTNSVMIDLTNQSNGIYFVILRQNNNLEKIKLIKR